MRTISVVLIAAITECAAEKALPQTTEDVGGFLDFYFTKEGPEFTEALTQRDPAEVGQEIVQAFVDSGYYERNEANQIVLKDPSLGVPMVTVEDGIAQLASMFGLSPEELTQIMNEGAGETAPTTLDDTGFLDDLFDDEPVQDEPVEQVSDED